MPTHLVLLVTSTTGSGIGPPSPVLHSVTVTPNGAATGSLSLWAGNGTGSGTIGHVRTPTPGSLSLRFDGADIGTVLFARVAGTATAVFEVS